MTTVVARQQNRRATYPRKTVPAKLLCSYTCRSEPARDGRQR